MVHPHTPPHLHDHASGQQNENITEGREAPETLITDSNVDITISNGAPPNVEAQSKKSDPWPMIIIAVILMAMAAYGYLMRKGI